MRYVWIILDPISGDVIDQCKSLEAAIESTKTAEPTRAALTVPGWDTLKAVIYRYEVENGKPVNGVKVEYE